MATIQVRVDDALKTNADALFSGLGLDTPTAVRIFLCAALENDGFPFQVSHTRRSAESREALVDARLHRNLYGPFSTAEDAVKAMLED